MFYADLFCDGCRFKNHKKALITSVDKKIPNGFLEEQGTLVLHSKYPPEHENEMLPFPFYSFFYLTCKFIFLMNKKSLLKGGKVGEVDQIS